MDGVPRVISLGFCITWIRRGKSPGGGDDPWWLLADDYTLDLQTDLSIALAEEGFAVWNIEFRRLGNGGEWPVIFQDITAARDFLATLTDTYDHPLDLTAVTVMGHSSGGHLALWLAGSDQLDPTSDIYSPTDIPIKGVVGLGPITDLNSPICRTSVSRLIADSGLDPTERATQCRDLAQPCCRSVASIMISGAADAIAPRILPNNMLMLRSRPVITRTPSHRRGRSLLPHRQECYRHFTPCG